jgi:hypothetical protein
MNTILDPGHKYQVLTLDGADSQILTFVKRFDLENPEKYPGNINGYPGTTLQSVMQCLIERTKYLQNQIPCEENLHILYHLRSCIKLLEKRAANRHGLPFYQQDLPFYDQAQLCAACGHTVCQHR